jgi:hypothetical protein
MWQRMKLRKRASAVIPQGFDTFRRTKILEAALPETVAVTSTRSLAGALVSVMIAVARVTVVPL